MSEEVCEPGTFRFHELAYDLDKLSAAFRCDVVDHPAVMQTPDWDAKATQIATLLEELRDTVSAKEDAFFETPETSE